MHETQPKKVLIVESGEGVGGSAFSMYRIVKYLDKQKFEPHVVVYYRAAAFAEIEKLGVPVTLLPLPRPFPQRLSPNGTWTRTLRNYISVYGNWLADTFSNGIRLVRFISRSKIDIVHCNNGFFENFSAALAARLTGRPCVSHVRGTEPLMIVERKLRRWIARFIVLNHEMLDVYSKAFGAEKVRLVHNGVDLDDLKNPDAASIRAEFGLQEDAFVVGTFARLVEGKGIPEFLQAAAKASRSRSNLRFFIAGVGSAENPAFVDQLKDLRDKLGLGDTVIFAGWREDVNNCMAAMDLVLQVSTTFPEGMSLAPIEAMALSKPVVVTDIAGYANIVDDGRSGYIVRAGDVDRLAQLIGEMADDPDLAHQLGERAYERVLQMFEYRIVARRLEEVYLQALRC